MKIYQVVISTFISLATMSSAFARNCEFPSVPPPTGYVCDVGGFLVKDPFAQPSQPELGSQTISISCSKPSENGLFSVELLIQEGQATAKLSQGSESWTSSGKGGYSIGAANTRLAGIQIFSFQLDDGSNAWIANYPISEGWGADFTDVNGQPFRLYCSAKL